MQLDTDKRILHSYRPSAAELALYTDEDGQARPIAVDAGLLVRVVETFSSRKSAIIVITNPGAREPRYGFVPLFCLTGQERDRAPHGQLPCTPRRLWPARRGQRYASGVDAVVLEDEFESDFEEEGQDQLNADEGTPVELMELSAGDGDGGSESDGEGKGHGGGEATGLDPRGFATTLIERVRSKLVAAGLSPTPHCSSLVPMPRHYDGQASDLSDVLGFEKEFDELIAQVKEELRSDEQNGWDGDVLTFSCSDGQEYLLVVRACYAAQPSSRGSALYLLTVTDNPLPNSHPSSPVQSP